MASEMAKHSDRAVGAGQALASDSILDLRRGDADDDRTSPYGRGWRSIVISTALESNYLTASIAFVALIIVPALLVGIAAPLLLRTAGPRSARSVAVIRSHPFAALACSPCWSAWP